MSLSAQKVHRYYPLMRRLLGFVFDGQPLEAERPLACCPLPFAIVSRRDLGDLSFGVVDVVLSPLRVFN